MRYYLFIVVQKLHNVISDFVELSLPSIIDNTLGKLSDKLGRKYMIEDDFNDKLNHHNRLN